MTDPLFHLTLHLADNALILGHRNSEWCGHGPVLEQDLAITNISLDLIGQARNFYQYAALLSGNGATEDSLAYLRNPEEFRNIILAELPRGDWAVTILRQFFFSNYQSLLYQSLQHSHDAQLAAIAAKAVREVAYHLRWSSEWVIRLGDGTEESHQRLQKALVYLWPYTGAFFLPADFESATVGAGIGVDVTSLREPWLQKTGEIFSEAGLSLPALKEITVTGKEGSHEPYLTELLGEMQYLQRTYPDATW